MDLLAAHWQLILKMSWVGRLGLQVPTLGVQLHQHALVALLSKSKFVVL